MSNKKNIYIGLMTGTSIDAIDAVAVRFLNNSIVSTGGRVLAATGISNKSLEHARELAYLRLEEVQLEGSFFRRDIGHKVLKK